MDVNEINIGDRVHANPSSDAEPAFAGTVTAVHRNPGGALNGIVRVERDADGRETDVGAAACTKAPTGA